MLCKHTQSQYWQKNQEITCSAAAGSAAADSAAGIVGYTHMTSDSTKMRMLSGGGHCLFVWCRGSTRLLSEAALFAHCSRIVISGRYGSSHSFSGLQAYNSWSTFSSLMEMAFSASSLPNPAMDATTPDSLTTVNRRALTSFILAKASVA